MVLVWWLLCVCGRSFWVGGLWLSGCGIDGCGVWLVVMDVLWGACVFGGCLVCGGCVCWVRCFLVGVGCVGWCVACVSGSLLVRVCGNRLCIS